MQEQVLQIGDELELLGVGCLTFLAVAGDEVLFAVAADDADGGKEEGSRLAGQPPDAALRVGSVEQPRSVATFPSPLFPLTRRRGFGYALGRSIPRSKEAC